MRSWTNTLTLLALAWMSACTSTHPPATVGPDAGSGDRDAGAVEIDEAGEDATVDYDKLIALCEASPAEQRRYDDEAELVELLIGKWIDCRRSTGFHPDQDGVWFREDKTWAALFFGPNAAVRTGAGVDGTGEWDIYYEPDPGPQRPALSVGGGRIVRPAFTRDPIQLRNVSDDEDGEFLDRYVRLRDVLQQGDAGIAEAGCDDPVELPLLVQDAPLAPLEASDQGSGIVRCKDGSMRRERAVLCPTLTERYGSGLPRGGRNVTLPDDAGVALQSACETDDDCDAGYVCRCATDAAAWTECVPGNCASASDCRGKECGGQNGICGELDAFFCRTEEDACRVLTDCPPHWNEDEDRWLVGAFCTHDPTWRGRDVWGCEAFDGDCE